MMLGYRKAKVFTAGKNKSILNLDIYLFMQKRNKTKLNRGPERASDLLTATQHFRVEQGEETRPTDSQSSTISTTRLLPTKQTKRGH